MPNAANGAEPQAGAGTEPQEGTAAGGQEPRASTGQEPASEQPPESAEEKATRLERELSETRAEAAKNRRKAQDLERAQQQAQQQGMSELERAVAAQKAAEERATALEAQVRAQAIESATSATAARLNYRNPAIAHRLLDQAALEFDDAGQPKNVEHLLRELAKAEPYLVKTAAGGDYGGGDRGSRPDAEPGMNELLRAAIRGG